MKIRWLFILKGFVSDGCDFENNVLPNTEPVKFSKSRRYMMTTSYRRKDEESYGVLYKLESVNRSVWKVIEKRVAVVKLSLIHI